MKPLATRSLLLAAALALCATSAFAAGGVNLSWNDCGPFGLPAMTSACLANTGANTMVASIITPVPMPQLSGMAGVIDLQTNTASLNPWWAMQSTGCRPTALSTNFNFTTYSNCLDPWGGVALGGMAYTYQYGQPNRGRIRTLCAVYPTTASDGVSEYYMFAVTINNENTVGAGACAGCEDGACIVLNSIEVSQPPAVGDYTVSSPLLHNYITWQSGTGSSCPGATPTRNSTWGSVKSLYR